MTATPVQRHNDGHQHIERQHRRDVPLTLKQFLMLCKVADNGLHLGRHNLVRMPVEAFDHLDPDERGDIVLTARIRGVLRRPHAKLYVIKHHLGFHAHVSNLSPFFASIDAATWDDFHLKLVLLVQRLDEYIASMGRGPTRVWPPDVAVPGEVAG